MQQITHEMSNIKSLAEFYIQEEVKASLLASLVEGRRKSLDTLTKENERLRNRAENLEKKIIELEKEILHENDSFQRQNSDFNMLVPVLERGNVDKSVCELLTTIMPSQPNEEQLKSYLKLLGQSQLTSALTRYMQHN